MEILIPTYNRREPLLKNLNELVGLICDEAPRTKIIISDNASTDGTDHSVNEFIRENENVNIRYFRNAKNIGLEENAVKVLSLATEDYIMFLGDDDYIPKGYLKYCFKSLSQPETVGAIMPSKLSLFEGEVPEFKKSMATNQVFPPGFESALSASHIANQMSGMVLYNPPDLLKAYHACGYRSIYLFIYFLTYNMLRYKTVLAFEYSVFVTTFNKKDWAYNEIGLLDEVFQAYYPFDKELGNDRVNLLLLKFTKIQGWRFGIVIKKPYASFKRFKRLQTNLNRGFKFKALLFVQFVREYLFLMRKIIN